MTLYYDERLWRRESAATVRARGIPEDAALVEFGIHPLSSAKPTTHDPRFYRFVDAGTEGDAATGYRIAWQPVEKPLDRVKATLKKALAAKRWEVECGGLTLPDGTRIATDDRSKTLLGGKYRDAEKHPDKLHRWKGPEGECLLTSAQVIAVGDAVAHHVQACFDRELDGVALIDAAGSVAAVLAVNIDGGWPGMAEPAPAG